MFSPIFTVLPVATVIYSTTGSLSLKRNAVLLQILHNRKIHTLQLDVKFQRRHSMFTHTAGMWKTRSRRFPKEVNRNGGKSIWNFLFQLKSSSWVWSLVKLYKQNWSRIWLSWRPFCSSTTPNPPTTKMVVKPRTKSKRKMWWCSILMQQWIIRSCRQANSSRAFLLSKHPVY